MKTTDNTIDALVADLSPVRAAGATTKPALLWLFGSLAYVFTITLVFGPLRPGVEAQLLGSPRFASEMLLGLLGITLAALGFMRSAVPAAMPRWLWLGIALCVGLWLLNHLVALGSPALEPSMLGKRPHCFVETLLYALPPVLVAIYLQRRLYPLRRAQAAMLAGLASGLMPAWIMQIACMYEPQHILTLHVLPGFMMALIAPLLVLLLPQKR